MTPDDLEWHMAQLQILKTELEENPLEKKPATNLRRNFVGRSGRGDGEEGGEEGGD